MGRRSRLLAGVSQSEDPPLSDLGALYQAPDGTLYQMHGLAEDPETGTEAEPEADKEQDAGDEPPMKAMGPRARRVRRFPGRRPPGLAPRRGAPGRRRKRGGFFKKLLPIAKFATRFIPGIGPVGSDIFAREVQAVWPEHFPSADASHISERASDKAG